MMQPVESVWRAAAKKCVVNPASIAGLAGVVLLAGAGCNKSEASPAREKAPQSASEGAASPRVETANYTIEIRPKSGYAKGSEGAFEVVLETKGDYHINEQYPYKFTPKESEGAAFKGPVGREAGQFDKTKAVLTVPFTPTKAGPVVVGGKLALSVCSDKNCLMEKQDLEVPVAVK
jgi:hypothetical protein